MNMALSECMIELIVGLPERPVTSFLPVRPDRFTRRIIGSGIHAGDIKTISYVLISHPFIERLIGTIRREYLDNLLFWGERDLARKLEEFRTYYHGHRVHLR
jgi:hypothetical protein